MFQLQCARCSVPSPQLNTVTAVFNLPPSTENANCGVTIHGHFNKNPLAHSPSHRADAAVKLQLRCRASKNKNNRISPIIMCHHCLRSHSRCRSSGRRRGTWAHAVIGRRRAAVARGALASQPPSHQANCKARKSAKRRAHFVDAPVRGSYRAANNSRYAKYHWRLENARVSGEAVDEAKEERREGYGQLG